MKLAIMQPYFFPYIGYFQLMNAVDEFVVYDNIQFTKQGWFNRNRILVNGTDAYITFPLKNDSNYHQVRERCLADNWPSEQKKILGRIESAYRKAPYFKTIYPLIEKCILFEDLNLFNFIYNSMIAMKEYLGINTQFVVSSTIPIDHELKGELKVRAICKARKADIYFNPIGGIELYDKQKFKSDNIELNFLKTTNVSYPQFKNEFIASLSIIDVLMFNSLSQTKEFLHQFILL